jgi:hypothetical protein
VEEPEHRLAAGEEEVMVGLHIRLCKSQGFARHVERKAMSCEGQDIQAATPLTAINEKTRDTNKKMIAYRKAEYL